MSDKVNFVVTNSEWDQNFDDVSIGWIYLKIFSILMIKKNPTIIRQIKLYFKIF